MASRMIHYTVAKLITDQVEFKNRNLFYVGSLAPDMVSYEGGRHMKRRSHFFERNEKLGVKGYNWLKFYQKYLKGNMYDEFALGYLVHLICDSIWVTDIQMKYIYSKDPETLKKNINKNYEDNKRHSYYIAEKYGMTYNIKPLRSFSVEEVNIQFQSSYLKDLKQDFLPYGNGFELEIQNMKAIINYIEKCIIICVKEIKLVMDNKEPDSPIPFMVPVDL